MSRRTLLGFIGWPVRVAKTSVPASASVRALCAASSCTTHPDSATVRLPADVFGGVKTFPRQSHVRLIVAEPTVRSTAPRAPSQSHNEALGRRAVVAQWPERTAW